MGTLKSRTLRRAVLALVAVVATGSAIAIAAAPAGATTLTAVSVNLSNNATSSATTANTATYTWSFTTSSDKTISSITFTVPSGTSLSGPSTTAYGLTVCSGVTSALDSETNTVTVSLTCGEPTASGTPVEIAIGGFTNATTAGDTTSTVTVTYADTTTDSGSATMTLASNTTAVTVVVPESLTFTNDTTALSLLPIPGGGTVDAAPVTLSVGTNATSGYDLSACDTGLRSSSYSIPAAGTEASSLSDAFGAEPGAPTGSATLGAEWAQSKYTGYPTTCSASGQSLVLTDTGPTSGDSVALTNGVNVSASQAAGTYTDTISYLVTPSY